MAKANPQEIRWPLTKPDDWPNPNVNYLLALTLPNINPLTGMPITWQSMSAPLNNRILPIVEDRSYDIAFYSDYTQVPFDGYRVGRFIEQDPSFYAGFLDEYETETR